MSWMGCTYDEFCERYGGYVTYEQVRDVWLYISKDPSLTRTELAEMLGVRSKARAAAALRFLRDAGYIDFESGRTGVAVIVPAVQEFTP